MEHQYVVYRLSSSIYYMDLTAQIEVEPQAQGLVSKVTIVLLEDILNQKHHHMKDFVNSVKIK